jgi:hypothetical protein
VARAQERTLEAEEQCKQVPNVCYCKGLQVYWILYWVYLVFWVFWVLVSTASAAAEAQERAVEAAELSK